MKRTLSVNDILPYDAYEKVRAEKRAAMIARKKNRRVSVGPCATFYFENYDTMWLQVQEMLRIEKGGEEQLADELRAYKPLVPKGNELVATVMLEIEDPKRRAAVLAVSAVCKTHRVAFRRRGLKAKAEQRSRLHVGRRQGVVGPVRAFPLHAAQIVKFRAPGAEIVVAVTHPNYGHMAVMPEIARQELAKDL